MEFSITTAEYQRFENHYLIEVMKNPHYRYGQAFLNYFHPIAENFLLYWSHVATSAGVIRMGDDTILWNMRSAKEAESFIRERIEII